MSERESDLKSFPNESISSTYDGPNVAQSAVESAIPGIDHTVQEDSAGNFARLIELVYSHAAALELKSQEITSLTKRLANCEVELDKKDEICQEQAIKIVELNQIVEDLKSQLDETSYALEPITEQMLSLRYF